MPIFIKFEGGKPPIRGSISKGTHKGWLALDSVSISTSGKTGMMGTGRAGRSSLSEISGVTSAPEAGSDLFTSAALGGGYSKVTIEFCKGEDGAPSLTYTLKDALVVSVSTSGGPAPATHFTLTFTELTYDWPGPSEGKSASLMQFDIDRALA